MHTLQHALPCLPCYAHTTAFIVFCYGWAIFLAYTGMVLGVLDLCVHLPWKLYANSQRGIAQGVPVPTQVRVWTVGKALTSFLVGAILTVVAFSNAQNKPHVHRVELTLPHWPAALHGLTMVQLSDTHVGITIGKPQIDLAVAMTNELKPDLVVITGDLMDGDPAVVAPALASLANLTAPYGVLYVNGNHEYELGVEYLPDWRPILRSLGIRPLENERLFMPAPCHNSSFHWWSSKLGTAEPAGPGVYFAGVHDYAARHRDDEWAPDLDAALAGKHSNITTVLLAHQPNHLHCARRYGVNLQLAGHTHQGQLFPVHIMTWLANDYFAGLYQPADDTFIYVNRGTNQWGPPARFLSHREITLFTLYSPDR